MTEDFERDTALLADGVALGDGYPVACALLGSPIGTKPEPPGWSSTRFLNDQNEVVVTWCPRRGIGHVGGASRLTLGNRLLCRCGEHRATVTERLGEPLRSVPSAEYPMPCSGDLSMEWRKIGHHEIVVCYNQEVVDSIELGWAAT